MTARLARHWPLFAGGLFVVAAGLHAQAPPPKKADVAAPEASVKELVARQQNLERNYKTFTTNLLALAQKLEKSERIEDKDKAKALRKAIDLADKEGVDNKFTMLLKTLSKTVGDPSIGDLDSATNQNNDIIKVMKEILAILQSDDELARIKAEKEYLEKLLADLNGIIRGNKIVDSRATSNKGDPKQLSKDQQKLADQTAALAEKMGAGRPSKKDGDAQAKGNPKPGQPMDEGQGEDKPDTKDAKADERKNDNPADPMKGDGAEAKPSKGGPPSEAKPGKGGPPSDSKPKPKDPQGDQQQPSKPAEPRNKEDNKGDQKGQASPMSPMGEQQANAKPQGKPSDGSPSGTPKPGGSGNPPPPGNPPPGAPKAPGAESVKKAIPDEENAAANLDQNKRPQASDDIQKALDNLQAARDELEKRLKQLREQELERILANLEQRVNKMLQAQIAVKSATESINAVVQKHPEKKPQPADFQNALRQEDAEAAIIEDADKAIQLLQSEGSAVAFPAVFEEVRKDMSRVKERLHDANVGEDTIGIEQDIIDSLTHMRDALKKAQQELGKSPPKPPGDPAPDEPQLKKLLDEIAELKMIRQLQVQVNARTKRYGEKTPMAEQSDDPQIKKEMKDLGERQEKIETMVNNMVTKKNQ